MKITEDDYWKLREWLKKEHLEKYNRWGDNIRLIQGELYVDESNNIGFTQRQILIKILEQHPLWTNINPMAVLVASLYILN